MKKTALVFAVLLTVFVQFGAKAQRIEEACEIISTSIKDNAYKEFTIDGSGFLSYIWSGKNGSETSLSVDMIRATVSKQITPTGYCVWINCTDGVNCITEKGIVGSNENFYGEYNKTYLPAKSEGDMDAIYLQLDYLLRLANEIR